MENVEIYKTQKNAKDFICESCDFKCSIKFDYARHLSTRKHVINVNGNHVEIKKNSFECNCGKEYKSISGLWKHKKICNYENVILHKEPTNNEIIEIMKIQMIENQELRKLLVEQQKQMIEFINNSNNITNKTNINNKIS